MKKILIPLFALVLFCAAVFPAHATMPELRGVVLDQNGQGIGGVWVEWKSGPGGDGAEGDQISQVTKYVQTNADGTFFMRQVFNKPTTCSECSGKWTYPNVNPTDPGYCYRFREDPAEGCLLFDAATNYGYSEQMLLSTRIDTDLDGSPDKFYLQTNASDQRRATYDLNCKAYNHVVSVVIPKTKPGLTCTPATISGIQNGQITDVTLNCNYTPQPTTQPTGAQKVQKTTAVDIDTSKDWNNFQCANAQACNDETNCSGYEGTNTKRRLQITGLSDFRSQNNIADNETIILVECITNETDATSANALKRSSYNCTSGNTTFDNTLGISAGNASISHSGITLYGNDGTTKISNGLRQSDVTANQDTVYLESNVANNQGSVIIIAYPSAKGSETTLNTESLGQKQATLSFNTGCYFHDPYGRVFDAKTLEPLPLVTVTLDKKVAQNYSKVTNADTGIGIVNPQTTSTTGVFSFQVPDGTYRLTAQKPAYVAADISILNSNYSSFYQNVYTGADIVQKGHEIQTDIPLSPLDIGLAIQFAKNNPVQIVDYLQTLSNDKKTYQIEGAVTHPKAKVELVAHSGNAARVLTSTQADMFGKFTVRYNATKMEKGDRFALRAWKAAGFEGSTDTSLLREVYLEPMLASVRGIAYDESGNILPGAKVGVMVPFSKNPVYETNADEHGRFVIPTARIPEFEYSLSYTTVSGKSIATTTSDFLAKNPGGSGSQFIAQASTDDYVLGASDTYKEVFSWKTFIELLKKVF